jgi:hypothetical protein
MQKTPIGEVPSTDLVRAETVLSRETVSEVRRRYAMEVELAKILAAAKKADASKWERNGNWGPVALSGIAVWGLLCAGLIALTIPAAEAKAAPGTGVCTTACGTKVFGAGNDCSTLNAYEARVLGAFEGFNPEWARAKTCKAVGSYWLNVVPSVAEEAPEYESSIVGLTRASRESRQVFVLQHKTWDRTAYAHEMLHVVEFHVDGVRKGDHEGWEEKGYNKLLSGLEQ